MKSIFSGKILALGLVVFLLMFGLHLIQGVVNDRQLHRGRAVASIGSQQALIGPLIVRSCVERWDEPVRSGNEVKTVERERTVRVLSQPESLSVKSRAEIEPRARGLHSVNAYTLKLQMSAAWANLERLRVTPERRDSRVSCNAPVLMVAVSDANGIRSARVSLNGQALSLRAGTTHSQYPRGVHAALPAGLTEGQGAAAMEFEFELFGVERLSFVPVAESTQVQMQSNWRHPSFGGSFLPTERTIGSTGFDATWRVSSLASSVGDNLRQSRMVCTTDGQEWAERNDNCLESLKVGFIDPVNPYTLSDRAVKYGILFVVLTFAAVGLFEVMQRLRVHPIQYFLVGSAISIFFLLLLSLSEHMTFRDAYVVAAGSCVLLLGYYGAYMLGGFWNGLPFGLGVAVLYGLLYVLLQLEQTALMVGSLALFAVLSAIMFLTRKVDWYRLTRNEAVS